MCGWRKTMEDADIFDLDIDGKGTNLLAVFDGHGGA
jgi:serine/threonine protein phosphatase PrpC